MNFRKLFGSACLLPLLLVALTTAVFAQQELPWKNNGNGQSNSGGRDYQEPGERFDPSRHAGDQSQTYPQRGYDRGYDALRNENRPAQQPYPDRNGPAYDPRPYDANRGYETTRPYENQPQYRRPGYSPQSPARALRPGETYPSRTAPPRQAYPSQTYPRQYTPPRQGYQPPAIGGAGQPYAPPQIARRDPYQPQNPGRTKRPSFDDTNTFSDDEILDAGHRFFGKVTTGLAKVIAHLFKKSGRPNAYILGEEGGGALIAGLRYGEGTLFTKSGERHPIYWQGPSVGYDFGAEGAKTMVLVYHLNNIDKIYKRYGGVDGSAYLVGGVGVTFQKRGNVVLAPIRTGVGVRLGANVGYLKYTRRPTWNPF